MFSFCKVLLNDPICEGYYRLRLDVGEMAGKMLPGQFVMLHSETDSAAFLPRPFSLHSVDANEGMLEIIYKVVGLATKEMTRLLPGRTLSVQGPLGTHFPIPEGAKRLALVGRGVGAAPMLFLARTARRQGIDVFVYLSASSEEMLFDRDVYAEIGCTVRTTTDAAALVSDQWAADAEQMPFDCAYTCGSKRLMREIVRISALHGIPSYASVEEHMACGVGACKGCVCQVKDDSGAPHAVRVCKEGPVFLAERLVQ